MSYAFQSWSVNQVLTSSAISQTEVNIRDHGHGASGVNQTVGAAPTASGHYAHKGYADLGVRTQSFGLYGLRVLVGRLNTTSGVAPNSLVGPSSGPGWYVSSYEAAGRITMTFVTSWIAAPYCVATAVTTDDLSTRDEVSVTAATVSQLRFNRQIWAGGTYAGRDGYVDFLVVGQGYT